MESSIEESATSAESGTPPTDEVKASDELEPTKDEMERERLISRAEQVSLI